MRLEELKNKTDEEQNEMIWSCPRIIEYLPLEDRWKVSDMRLFDMDSTSYWHHFTREELENQFGPFCEGKGFIIDI